MGTPDEANYAIQTCNGTDLDGAPTSFHPVEFVCPKCELLPSPLLPRPGRALLVRLDQKPEKEPRAPRAPRATGAAGAKPARGGDPSLEGKAENSSGLQVVVRNLPWSVTSEMLRGTFEQIGAVNSAEVVSHADSGRSKGWGIVKFTKPEDSADAIARFGGVELAGRPMTVMMDRYN